MWTKAAMIVPVEGKASAERIVVVSPHFDDGVLSLGASMASWCRAGATVLLLTVFGCDPDSTAPSGGWDRRGGFGTEGESARARREEDRLACAVLGATSVPLPFGSVDYERHGEDGDVRAAIAPAVEGADLVLLPGFPLSHPDHDWLVRTLVSDFKSDTRLSSGPIGLYGEQPYTRRAGTRPHVHAWLAELVGPAVFERIPVRPRDRVAKWRAIRSYRSQLPLLGMRRSLRRGPHRYALGREWVARLPD
jgi:LmbE family N-acetylglucosaminyl deacetylase